MHFFVGEVVCDRQRNANRYDNPPLWYANEQKDEPNQEVGSASSRNHVWCPFSHIDDVFILFILQVVGFGKPEQYMVFPVVLKPTGKERKRSVQIIFMQLPFLIRRPDKSDPQCESNYQSCDHVRVLSLAIVSLPFLPEK